MPAHDLRALREGLAAISADQLDPPETGRVGATLVLLAPTADGDVTVVYTRRQAHLSSHPGQISFPGGRVDPGEGIVDAALREAAEEVGLQPSTVEVLGRLPALYIPPSRFWMSAVVAWWRQPHPLTANTGEVAEILSVPTATLRDPQRWRVVPLTAAGSTWAWDLGPGRLLWGATAIVTGVLLQVADPRWSGGVDLQDLPASAQVRPWEDPVRAGLEPTAGRPRPRLRDVGEEVITADADTAAPTEEEIAAAVVWAVDRLVRRPPGPVVVLAGPGRTGAVAREVAARLGPAAQLLDVRDGADVGPAGQLLRGAGVVVDGLMGRGFTAPIHDPAREVVRLLSLTGAPLVAIDLPSGMDPDAGIVGDVVSADVTVAAAPLVPAHVAPGAAPFTGDLYLVRRGRPPVRADVTGRPRAWAE